MSVRCRALRRAGASAAAGLLPLPPPPGGSATAAAISASSSCREGRRGAGGLTGPTACRRRQRAQTRYALASPTRLHSPRVRPIEVMPGQINLYAGSLDAIRRSSRGWRFRAAAAIVGALFARLCPAERAGLIACRGKPLLSAGTTAVPPRVYFEPKCSRGDDWRPASPLTRRRERSLKMARRATAAAGPAGPSPSSRLRRTRRRPCGWCSRRCRG